MLQRQAFQEHTADEEHSQFLSLAYIFDIVKRRWLHFTIPFVVLAAIGSAIAMLLPATYLASGKILVESPQIPSDLVRPTVAVLANERIQIIQQRIMTRDNLLALAKKFQISANWQGRMSGTDLVDFIKSRVEIAPLDVNAAPGTKKGRNDTSPVIAFSVGFTYEKPEVATKVANELMTMILNEDVRGRTNSATEATRFLAQEVKRLEGQISLIDTQIASLSQTTTTGADGRPKSVADAGKQSQSTGATQLAALKAELVIKNAMYTDQHPEIRALKSRIDALEKAAAADNAAAVVKPVASDSKDAAANSADGNAAAPKTTPAASTIGLDALQTQKTNLTEELNGVTRKLATARLGENLERGQFAERLQVIEQPTIPDKPVQPNRPKILAFAFAFAFAASGGLVFAAELLNPAIRRTSDLFAIIDSHLIVSIPYVTTEGELRSRKKKFIVASAAGLLLAMAAAGAVLFILPPLDVLFAKMFPGLG